MSFTSIPILDLELARHPATKPAFLDQLLHALVEVGFLYLKNAGIPAPLLEEVMSKGKAFFEMPLEEKLKIQMIHTNSFLGYSRLSTEITAHQIDHREQFDLSTNHALPAPNAPLYHNLLAPNQWPSEIHAPGFRATYTEYMSRMGDMSVWFTSLIAEAIGLPGDAFNKYFDEEQQHKLKIVRYPDVAELRGGVVGRRAEDHEEGEGEGEGEEEEEQEDGDGDGMDDQPGQGVGPHKDSMLTSYLLQASPHRGLQVQNMQGRWVDCPPVEGTLVVAIGQGLEALTRGVCVSTTHRVLSPAAGAGARFSIPFFQGVKLDAAFEDLESVGVGRVPEEVRRVRAGGRMDDVEFTFRGGGVSKTLGEATLRNRIKSHPDVGEKWYPDLLRAIREEQAAAAGAIEGS